jgi:hypothetical protein
MKEATMALPKILRQTDERIERIEAKLDEVLAMLAGTPETNEPPVADPPVDPAVVAAALDYDSYSAKEIIDRAPSLEGWQRSALVAYEQAHSNRATVIKALSA